MSKSVTIPTYMQPDWFCTINNTTYRYKAGTTQTVPDEVAELIEAINAQQPVENPPETPEEMAKRIADAEIADNLELIDFTSVALVAGTPKKLGDWDADKLDRLISGIALKPVSVMVKYSGTDYQLIATESTEEEAIFSSPLMDADGAVTGILGLKIYDDDYIFALLQFTEMPE